MSVAEARVAAERIALQTPRLWRGSLRLYRSELRLILGRRRNQAGVAVLAAVPVIMAISVRVSEGGGGGPPFVAEIIGNGLFVAFAALIVESAMFLPLAVAMLSGDAIAGEAYQGTLRYLLTVPVSRTRLLVVKYAALCTGALWGVLAIAVTGAVIGVALFGAGELTTLSGVQISTAQGLWRLVLACAYLTIGLCGLAAVGLFVSTLTEQPMAVTVSVMIFTILSWILDEINQVAWLHPYLLVHEWMSVADVLREPVAWESMSRGVGVAAVYALVFWLAAWARLGSKDITS